jgi:hypothetical protein
MLKQLLVCVVLAAALAFSVAPASACPKDYHQCGSFCCGN